MLSPLDLQRLAYRIENLQRVVAHGWRGGDDLEFYNCLPGGRDQRRALPQPASLREMADKHEAPTLRTWEMWVTVTQHLESLARYNDSHNPKRMMRDMARGRCPW